jgi:protein-S-isoprenylcysteine O-methyltransferase Ste14
MQWLELRIPPPVVAACFALLMWLAATSIPALDFALPARVPVALGVAAVGVALGLTAVFGFRRARTTVNPLAPQDSSALVVTGIYRWTRNPMYLGMLAILIAWALWLANAAPFFLLPLFMLYLNRFQIAPEERALQARFGGDFERYRGSVRRWL